MSHEPFAPVIGYALFFDGELITLSMQSAEKLWKIA